MATRKLSTLLAGVVALSVAGPAYASSNDDALLSCRLDVAKYHIGGKYGFEQQSEYLKNCMKLAGYDYVGSYGATDAESYRGAFWGWLEDRLAWLNQSADPGALLGSALLFLAFSGVLYGLVSMFVTWWRG